MDLGVHNNHNLILDNLIKQPLELEGRLKNLEKVNFYKKRNSLISRVRHHYNNYMPRLKVGFRIIILAICHLLKWLNKGLGEEQDLEVYPMHLIS